MNLNHRKLWTLLAVLLCAVALIASNGVINVVSRNQVSNESVTGYRWEPSTGAGSYWAASWATYPINNTNAVTSYVSAWNGKWLGPTTLTAPNGRATDDVNLSYDSVRNRFVFVLLDISTLTTPNVWYGYSTDATGVSWAFGNKDSLGNPQPVFAAASSNWDYPSIGVDSAGRVIIGSVNFSPMGYYAALSTDGEHFGAPMALPLSGSGNSLGARSRVVAAGSIFHVFAPLLNGQYLPTEIDRYQSADARNWSKYTVETFGAPLNSAQPSGSGLPIFYAPLLSAAGYPDGRWIVGWQRNNSGWNNMEVCTPDRGCGTVNSQPDDQFLAGVSVSADGYWAAYHTYSTLNNRSLPVITQAIYFRTGYAGIGATTNSNVAVTSWAVAGVPYNSPPPRCMDSSGGVVECYAAGDYNTPTSNAYGASNTTYVQSSSRQNDLFQSFQQDPQALPNAPNFVPNFVAHPMGANLSAEALPVPPESGAQPGPSRAF